MVKRYQIIPVLDGFRLDVFTNEKLVMLKYFNELQEALIFCENYL